MHITFNVIGLTFDAEVSYTPATPGRYSGPPEDCYPDDPAELDFISLECNGKDALFLRDADCFENIEIAAYEAAEQQIEDERCAAMESVAESRNDF